MLYITSNGYNRTIRRDGRKIKFKTPPSPPFTFTRAARDFCRLQSFSYPLVACASAAAVVTKTNVALYKRYRKFAREYLYTYSLSHRYYSIVIELFRDCDPRCV